MLANTNLPSWKHLFRVRFQFVHIVLSHIGGGIIVYLIIEKKPLIITASAIVVWLSLIVWLLFSAAMRTERDERLRAQEKETEQLKESIQREQRDVSIDLSNAVIDSAGRILRNLSEELRSISNHGAGHPDLAGMKRRQVIDLMDELIQAFKQDKRGVDSTTYPHSYFKAALFEHEVISGRGALHRTLFRYPSGLEPSPETAVFYIDDQRDQLSLAVRAYKSQKIEVLEDIKQEASRDEGVARWINKRHNQAKDYESMTCVPIVSGVQGEPDRKCLGVLVVDTNRKRYFLETTQYQAFLGTLLSPFRSALTLLLELDQYFAPVEGRADMSSSAGGSR